MAADRWGNVVVTTPSGLGSNAGSGGHTGITHGCRLVINNTWRGHPNAVGPGKRPRTSLTPTLVMRNGKPFLAISVAGGVPFLGEFEQVLASGSTVTGVWALV